MELPTCEHVVHRREVLIFLDQQESPLLCLKASDVAGYTLNRRVASILVDPTATVEVPNRPAQRRMRRRLLHRASRSAAE